MPKTNLRIAKPSCAVWLIAFVWLCLTIAVRAHTLPNADLQPFSFQTERLIETLEYLGSPLAPTDRRELEKLLAESETTAEEIQKILDKYALFEVNINPESLVKVRQGAAKPELWQGGWRTFLGKVQNEAGVTAKMQVVSPQGSAVFGVRGDGFNGFPKGTPVAVSKRGIANRWLDLGGHTKHPLRGELSGVALEYRIIQIYSRDAGKRQARIGFNVGKATQDIGFRNDVDVLFDCVASPDLTRVLNEDGKPTTASFVISDKFGNIYPAQSKRLAPDFYFQKQIYRTDSEKITLPAGDYVHYSRGPEYAVKTQNVKIVGSQPQTVTFKLERWIKPSNSGWYSGNHRIHAAGCSHYETPTAGILLTQMMKHILGEALNVGSVLTWGPCYEFQKQFFEVKENKLSTAENLMRYDIEISSFPASHAGHLVLFGMKDQNYPNTKKIADYPTWGLPILEWAKAQVAIVGYAHLGLGLEVKTEQLSNYEIPQFDGIGANEYIVAVTTEMVDSISTVDTPSTWELNIWYHTLNAGFRTRISGENDFPCMSGERVGQRRSYVKLERNLTCNDWIKGIRDGRAYVSDGKSHFLDYRVNGLEAGTNGSEVKLYSAETVRVTANVAALLNETPDEKMTKLRYDNNIWEQKPFWELERARIGKTRQVPVELIVNGEVAATKNIAADGSVKELSFDVRIEKSSWVALRILFSSHTSPIFVTVQGKPIRASRRSAEWCLKGVDQCWLKKSPLIYAPECPAAEKPTNQPEKFIGK